MIIIIIPLQLVIYSDWEIFSLTNWSRVDNALMSFDLQLSSADDKVSTESSHFTAGWRCTMLANSDVWRPDARLLTPLTSRILQSNAEPDHVSSLALHGGSHSKQNKQIEANIDNQCRTKMSWPASQTKIIKLTEVSGPPDLGLMAAEVKQTLERIQVRLTVLTPLLCCRWELWTVCRAAPGWGEWPSSPRMGFLSRQH